MHIFQWLLFGAIVAFSGGADAADPIFDAVAWESRVLVITGPKDEELYLEQVYVLADAYDGMEERYLIPVHYKDRTVRKIEGLSPFEFRYRRILRTPREQRYMQQRLGEVVGGDGSAVDDDIFSVILVGLDGLPKEIWRDVVDPSEIFDTIDAMPLRQIERAEELQNQ